MWDKPNEFYGVLRCTNVEYANKLMELGSIKFNTPQSWVKEGIKNGDGRGDIFEGTFAACSKFDTDSIKLYMEMYDDVYKEPIGELIYFRRKRTMELPCYCFFLFKLDLFECPSEEGIQRISGEISGEYFRDFTDYLTKAEVSELEKHKKPSFVFINNFDEFMNMVCEKLKSIGVKESEIMVEMIEYCDKSTEHYCEAQSPKELKMKPSKFSYQSEGRIIINTNNDLVIDYLKNDPIEIGSIENIAKKADGYFSEGMSISMKATVYKIAD